MRAEFDINKIFIGGNSMSEFSDGLAVGANMNNNCYPCVPAYGGYGNGNGMNGWGDGWWILLLLLCGWGNGGNWGGNNQFQGYEIGKLATTNDVASGFSTSTMMSNQRENQLSQQQGFADVQQTLCQGFSGVNATVNQVGNNINQGICNLGYNMQSGFNQLGNQISSCCCDVERAIDGVNYNMAKNTCDIQNAICGSTRDIIDSQRCGTDRIINFLTNQEMDRLRSENQTLRFERSQANQNAFITANQEAQTAEIIRRLGRDCPVPAYVVPNPNCCYDNNIFARAGWNNGGCCDGCC